MLSYSVLIPTAFILCPNSNYLVLKGSVAPHIKLLSICKKYCTGRREDLLGNCTLERVTFECSEVGNTDKGISSVKHSSTWRPYSGKYELSKSWNKAHTFKNGARSIFHALGLDGSWEHLVWECVCTYHCTTAFYREY